MVYPFSISPCNDTINLAHLILSSQHFSISNSENAIFTWREASVLHETHPSLQCETTGLPPVAPSGGNFMTHATQL
jgi:hypothetical protein